MAGEWRDDRARAMLERQIENCGLIGSLGCGPAPSFVAERWFPNLDPIFRMSDFVE